MKKTRIIYILLLFIMSSQQLFSQLCATTPSSCNALTNCNEDIAAYFAPRLVQYTETSINDGATGKANIPVAINYDGDWDHYNNWNNINNFTLTPTVYYSVVWTEDYWIIVYTFYYARDYAKALPFCNIDEHEGDTSRIMVVADRSTLTVVDAFDNSKTYSVVGNTPQVYASAGSHHTFTNDDDASKDKSGFNPCKVKSNFSVFYTHCTATPCGATNYTLVDVFEPEGVWDNRNNTLVWDSNGQFVGNDRPGSLPWAPFQGRMVNDTFDFITDNTSISFDDPEFVRNQFSCNTTENPCYEVVFHFEDDQGTSKTEFCIGEDVILDGSQTAHNEDYYIDIWRVNADGSTNWLSALGATGEWITGSPDEINITQEFENDPENPVTFTEGTTYRVKLVINDCGWLAEEMDFTYVKDEVIFHFENNQGIPETAFCNDDTVFLNGSLTSATDRFYLDIWRVNADGSTNWLSALGSNDGWNEGAPNLINITQQFQNDPENPVVFMPGVTYRVKLAIGTCGWLAAEQDFTIVNCLAGNDDRSCTTPLENISVDRQSLSWESVADAVAYEVSITVNRERECNEIPLLSDYPKIISSSYFEIPRALQNGCITWNVKALCRTDVRQGNDPNLTDAENRNITLSPNPTNGIITLQATQTFTNCSISIHKFDGLKIFEQQYQDISNLKLDISNQPSGMYIIHIRSGETVSIFKILKK